ncbi:MAG: O-antigen ligase family protein [Chloroflexota bacterium]
MQGSLKLPNSSPENDFKSLLLSLVIGGTAVIALVLFFLIADSDLGIIAFGGIIAIGLTFAIFMRPQWGAYILVVTIVTNVSTLLTRNGYPSINKPVVGVVFIAIAAGYLWNRQQNQLTLRLGFTELLLFIMGGVWFLSAMGARDSSAAFLQVTDYFKNFIILICIIYALRTPQQWKRAVWLLILATAVPAALGVYQIITGNYTQDFGGLMVNVVQQVVDGAYEARLSGPIREPNFYGQILAYVLVLAVYRVLDEKSLWLKGVAMAAAFCMALTAVYTYSRGAFVTIVVIMALIAIERRIRPSLIISIGLLVGLLLLFLPSTYSERISSITLLNPNETFESRIYEDASFRGRYSEILSGLLMFAEHPVLGVGIGNYDVNYQDYSSRLGLEYRFDDREAHSLYVESLAETGALGFLSLLGVIATTFMGLRAARQKITRLPKYAHLYPWFTSIHFALLSYMFSSIALHGDFMRYLFLLWALAVSAMHLTEQLVSDEGILIDEAGLNEEGAAA